MASFAINLLNSVPVLGAFIGNGFRPPQWSYAGPQLTSVTAQIPAPTVTTSASHTTTMADDPNLQVGSAQGNPVSTNTGQPSQVTYFFDAVFSVDHSQELRTTDHPVQSGASITDHAYLQPTRVTLEIGMSDSMDTYVAGQYSGSSTKSVNAYQIFLSLQASRAPLALATRLFQYQNMVIEAIRAHDDQRTRNALRASITFKQIIVGQVTSVTQSNRPDATTQSNQGTSQPTNLSSSQAAQLDNLMGTTPPVSTVP